MAVKVGVGFGIEVAIMMISSYAILDSEEHPKVKINEIVTNEDKIRYLTIISFLVVWKITLVQEQLTSRLHKN